MVVVQRSCTHLISLTPLNLLVLFAPFTQFPKPYLRLVHLSKSKKSKPKLSQNSNISATDPPLFLLFFHPLRPSISLPFPFSMERQPKSEEDDRTREKGTLYVYPSRPNLASSRGERDHHQYLPPVVVPSSSSRELKNKVVNMGPANHGDHDGTARRKEEQVVALRRVVTLSPSAKVKLAGVAVSLNVRLRSADMPPIMQERAFRFTRSLLLVNHEITTTTTTTTTNTYANPTHIARALKKEFDTWYGPAWHCIVGKSFGSFVTHSGGGFLYFSIDKLSVLLFKTAVRPVILDMDRDTDINLLPKQKNLSHNSNTVNLN